MYEGAEYQEEDGEEPREIFPGLLQGHDEHGENVVETQQFDELDPADQEKVQSLTQIYSVTFLQSRIIAKSANRFYTGVNKLAFPPVLAGEKLLKISC